MKSTAGQLRDQLSRKKLPYNIVIKQPTLAPIWFPHWPACRWTISRILKAFTC